MAYYLQVRLSEKKDADIIAWLEGQTNKSGAVRDTLRAAIVPSPTLDIGAIRAVVEAALDERLSGLALVNGDCSVSEPEGEDPELAAALDGMF